MKQGNTYISIILGLFLAAVVCYFGYYLYEANYEPLRTETAIEYEAGAGSYTTGFVVRDETAICAEYEVEITISYDSARNKLSYELVKDGDVVDEEEPFVFTNVYAPGGYDEPDDPYVPDGDDYTSPDTGDTGVALWVTLMILSALGFTAVLAAMRRRRA